MPSRGNSLHEYLKKCAAKKVVDVYGESLDFLKNEQPSDENGNGDQNYFKVNVSIGSGWHDLIGEENLNFPDLLAQINLTDNEKNAIKEKRQDGKDAPSKKIIIVECETTRSPLVSGKATPRYCSYKLIKNKYQHYLVFVLVTFKDIKVNSDLFDDVWRFGRPEKK